MKTSFKKLTAVFLAVLMVMSVFSVMAVFAADTGKTETGASTFKFTDNQGWGSVYVYCWDENGTGIGGEWPGVLGRDAEVNGFGETFFTIDVPDGAVGCVVNNGNGAQTSDITDFSVEGYYTDGTKNDKGHFNVIPWPGGSGGGEQGGGEQGGGEQGGGSGDTTTIHVTDNLGWGSMYVHYWGGSSETKWPGIAMNNDGDNGYGSTNFSATVPSDATGYVFNNGSGAQTVDVTNVNVEGYWLDGTQDDKGHYNVRLWGDTGEGGEGGEGGGGDDPYGGGGGGSLSNKFVAIIYCENAGTDDASRNSEHEFTSDGTLTYDFPGDSYVFVRNYDTGVQYCTDGWSNFANPVTLVNENTASQFDKMYVPAGTHTLYLSDNGDDTLTLSYDQSSGGGDDPTDPPVDPTDPPVDPTDPPVDPTDPPVNPTDAPVNPTDAPVNPTDAPVNPTDAPVNPTDSPVTPTQAPEPGSGLAITTALNGATINTIDCKGTSVTVTYNLQSPLLLEDGQGTLYYDTAKLSLASVSLPNVQSGLILNPNIPGEARFNFTGVNPVTNSGIFDFKSNKTFVTATFNVVGSGATTINLDIEELDGLENGQQVPYYTNKVAAAAASSITQSLAKPTVDVQGEATEPQPTTQGGGDTPVEPTTQGGGDTPTTPQPTQYTPTTPQPTVAPTTVAPVQPTTEKKVTAKKANPIKVKAKTVKVKASTLSKKALKIKIKKALKVTKAQGKKTYYKVKKGSTKKLYKKVKVAKTSGKITIKKIKLKKGKTYKLKIKVTAAGNSKYKKKSVSKVVKIKVK